MAVFNCALCSTLLAAYLRCNIQWLERWDDDAMQSVATACLQPVMANDGRDAPDTSKLVQQVVTLHKGRLGAGATPRHYLAFVNLCGTLYAKKRSQLHQQQDFLKVTPAPCLMLDTTLRHDMASLSGANCAPPAYMVCLRFYEALCVSFLMHALQHLEPQHLCPPRLQGLVSPQTQSCLPFSKLHGGNA